MKTILKQQLEFLIERLLLAVFLNLQFIFAKNPLNLDFDGAAG